MDIIKNLSNLIYIPSFTIRDFVEILIIIFVLYKIIMTLKNTRAWIVLKGILVLAIFYGIAYICSFDAIKLIFQSAITIISLALVVVFQQDIKKLLEQLGNRSYKQILFDLRQKKNKNDTPKRMSDKTIEEIISAAFSMGKVKTGALIVIEKDIPLDDIIATGISINGEVTSQLFINIFEKNTPLHDGAVIVKGDKIISATCYLPLSSNPNINKSLGTRHRAGIGITESSDCFVVIVSEETGKVSYVENGNIYRDISPEGLRKALKKIQEYPQTELFKNPQKHIFNENFKMKCLSVCFGLLLWMLIMGAVDPISEMKFEDIPIKITNESAIEEIDKTYDLGDTTTVDVTVSDRRSILDKLESSDISASIDLSKLSYVNTVDVEVSVNNNTTEIKKISDNVLKVELDDISYGEFPIEINTSGEPMSGYSIKNIELSETSVTVTGAESLIKKIDKVVAELNVANIRDGQEIIFSPVVYDKNGDKIDPSKLTLNINEISAYFYLQRTKSIPLNIHIEDEEGSAGQVKDITYEPSNITVIGDLDSLEAIEEIDSINIQVPVKIDISNGNNTKLTKVISLKDYEDYIPEGLTLQDPEQKITITITYDPYPSKEFTLETNKISLTGQKDTFEYKFITNSININAIAKSEILENLKNEDFKLSCDVSKITGTGTYDVTINIKTSKNIIVKDINTQVIVTNKPKSEDAN